MGLPSEASGAPSPARRRPDVPLREARGPRPQVPPALARVPLEPRQAGAGRDGRSALRARRRPWWQLRPSTTHGPATTLSSSAEGISARDARHTDGGPRPSHSRRVLILVHSHPLEQHRSYGCVCVTSQRVAADSGSGGSSGLLMGASSTPAHAVPFSVVTGRAYSFAAASAAIAPPSTACTACTAASTAASTAAASPAACAVRAACAASHV